MKKIIVLLPFLLFRIISYSQSSLVVNNKLKENKQVLNEDWSYFVRQVLPLLIIGLFAAIRIGFSLLSNENFKFSKLSKNVYDGLDDLYTDKEFVKDFVNILKKEDNLQDIVDNIIKQHKDYHYTYAPTKYTGRNSIEDKRFYQNYIIIGMRDEKKEWGWNAPEKRIIDNLMKSNGYKKFSKKHNFTKSDDTTMRALFYYMISRPDFAVNVKKYLFTAVEQNKPVLIRAIDKVAFDHDTAS
jgi:hypothetical protein